MDTSSITNNGILGASQEKDFDQLTNEEKIERCRMVIKKKQYSMDSLEERIQKLERFFNHEHVNGKIMIDIKTINNNLRLSDITNNKYF